jgi:hypothetical protein
MDAVRTRLAVDWPAVLHSIGQAAPTGVCVTHAISNDSQVLHLKGMALSQGLATAFVQSLDGETPFVSVRLTRVQRAQASVEAVEYEVDCILKPMKQEYNGGQGT